MRQTYNLNLYLNILGIKKDTLCILQIGESESPRFLAESTTRLIKDFSIPL